MEAKASKHASKREHACARVRMTHVRVRARARARARSLVATLPGRGPAEDGSELRSHACGVAKGGSPDGHVERIYLKMLNLPNLDVLDW
jgi:hypothetical protein